MDKLEEALALRLFDTLWPEPYWDVSFLRDDLIELPSRCNEIGELWRNIHVDAFVTQAPPIGLPQCEPATHSRRLSGADEM